MNIFQTIWIALTTPNEGLIGIIFNNWGIPFIFIEAIVSCLLFTQLFNVKYSRKHFIGYVIAISVSSGISNTILNKPFSAYLNMVVEFCLIIFIFKLNPFKAMIAEFVPFMIIAILESFCCKIIGELTQMTYNELCNIPLVRLFITFVIYTSLYLLYVLLKRHRFYISFIESMNTKNKIILYLNFIFAIIAINVQIYIIIFYMDNLPIAVTMLSIMSLIAYFFISIFSLLKTTKLERTAQSLEEAHLYNKTLQLLHDNLRTFKHDFSNIMQAFEGYIVNDDMDGLSVYYKSVRHECDNLNNLTALSPNLINDSGLYSLIASKYLLADEAGVTFNVHICVNFKEINVPSYQLARILGILLDNAIYAAKESPEKEILFEVTAGQNSKISKKIISVQNSYINKDVDLNRIREKGYTSKANDGNVHGLGLWEVSKILNKSENLNLYTHKNNKYFIQDLEIYDNK